MKWSNGLSIYIAVFLVLAATALFHSHTALAEDWIEVSEGDARISLDASSLREAIVYRARRKTAYGIAERGSWLSLTGGFPRAEIYAEILRSHVRYSAKFDLRRLTKEWDLLQGQDLKFGSRKTYWNRLGQGRYRIFSFQDHECVAFRQFWGQVPETRGVDAGTRMLIGYYCGPSGVSLSEQTIDSVLESVRVRSSGDLTVEAPISSSELGLDGVDGTWILEIGETSNRSNRDRVRTIVKDGKFSASFETNGWRGKLVGEIDKYGRLNVRGSMNKIGLPRKFISFTAPSQGANYETETETFGGWGNTFFMISLAPESTVMSGQ